MKDSSSESDQGIPYAPLILQATVQQYEWGKDLTNSVITPLLSEEIRSTLQAGPLAELWVGAHPKASAVVVDELGSGPQRSPFADQTLEQVVRENPVLLGKSAAAQFGAMLPFLFKVLSIGAPLSIQLHPDKEVAIDLHGSDPAHYPDANPKPEIGIALTETELLYGFRTEDEIRALLADLPVFTELLGSIATSTSFVEQVFRRLYELTSKEISNVSHELYRMSSEGTLEPALSKWLARIQRDYPNGDVGVLALCVLNIVTIPPQSALFIAPNVPHAYLSGDIIECMANSDNVIRAGLTKKFCDVPRLLSLADYSIRLPSSCALIEEEDGFLTYDTPSEYFSLSRFSGSGNFRSLADSMSLLFCLEGELRLSGFGAEHVLFPGAALAVPAGQEMRGMSVTGVDVFRVRVP